MEEKELRTLVTEELQSMIVNLSGLEPGSEERSKEVENVKKLYTLVMDDYKTEWEFADRIEKRDAEQNQFEKKLEYDRENSKKQRINNYIQIGADASKIVFSCVFGYFGTKALMSMGFDFETTGSITSTTFRNLYSKAIPYGLFRK